MITDGLIDIPKKNEPAEIDPDNVNLTTIITRILKKSN